MLAVEGDVDRIWSGADELETMLVPVSEISIDNENSRRHDKRSINSIASSLREFGQQKPIVLSGGTVIAGNGTVTAITESLGWTHVAAVKFKAPNGDQKIKAKGYKIADNRTAELSEWDLQRLGEELGELVGKLDLTDLGWLDYEVEPLLSAEWEPPEVEPLDDFGRDGEGDPSDETSEAHSLALSGVEYEVLKTAFDRIRQNDKRIVTMGDAILYLCEFYAAQGG
jgi:hypothetical protein